MPIYEYECSEHGEFELIRSMREAGEAGQCPLCLTQCRRIVSAPHVTGMPKAAVVAHERNERSQHEPRVASRHVCNSGCRHGATKSGAARGAGVKKYTGARPWVIEHA